MARFRLFVVCLVALSLFAPRLAHAQTPAPPQFAAADCPFKVDSILAEGKGLQCGWLTVPENRTLSNGKTIKLAVAILHSRAAHPAPDPVIFLNGGPGGSTLSTLGPTLTYANQDFWAHDRDVIFIDQRGTGYSQPALTCPEVVKEGTQVLAKHTSLAQEDRLETQAVAACRARLAAQGIDLSAYNSVQDAADIADLRTALGYSQVNVYGLSYGTRLALTVMRYYPQGIRSVVLDSVYGPSVNLFTDVQRSAARDFNLVLDSCAAFKGCNKVHPHLRTNLYTLVKRLDAKPKNVTVLNFEDHKFKVAATGEVLLGALFGALYDPSFVETFPDFVQAAAKGSTTALQQILKYIVPNTPNTTADGMYLSVECSEDFPGVTEADITAASQALPAPLQRDFTAGSYRSLHDCRQWNVNADPAGQKEAVVSDIPTMVMEGEYDPITPPDYGMTVAKTLSRSFTFVYPGLTHVTRFNPCPSSMMQDFLDNPTQKPDASCISSMQEPFGP